MQDSEIFSKLNWARLFLIKSSGGKYSLYSEYILRQVWTMQPEDKDLIVMYHKIGWEQDGELFMVESSMGVEGENAKSTAMAGTVGLPLGIATKIVLQGNASKGVQRPMTKEWFDPILEELARDFGVKFIEKEVTYSGY